MSLPYDSRLVADLLEAGLLRAAWAVEWADELERHPEAHKDVCQVGGCGRPRASRQWCRTHRVRHRLLGSALFARCQYRERVKSSRSCGRLAVEPSLRRAARCSEHGGRSP